MEYKFITVEKPSSIFNSTQVLGVLTGIPPLYISAKAEFQKFQVRVCRSSELGRVLDVGELDHFVKSPSVPIEFRIIDFKPQIENSQFDVYTNGSRIGDDCGFSVGILKNEHPFKIFKFKLNKNNTVFQAELAAINVAVRWAQEHAFKINIYTDSQSSIEALRNTRPRSAFVIEAKIFFIWLVTRLDGSKHMWATRVMGSPTTMQNWPQLMASI
ncbi:hypothetical protein AVEN_250890-1 [Araneus ventricosus]|uniref:RNase H type-1 domain-containing protein n=1 Tax=Araneus ventricosus TaxID=182803 RepID=A0A4Y2NMI6_ARAVE|nr:hypothetical protein AVEN_250890-1 [Araneus ventricosus]